MAAIAYDALLAIKNLHGLGLAHRDIKAENFVFDQRGKVKMIDLGFTDKLTGSGQGLMTGLKGTPVYAAPEVAEQGSQSKYFGAEVDMFAFGVLIFCLVAKDYPFQAT